MVRALAKWSFSLDLVNESIDEESWLADGED